MKWLKASDHIGLVAGLAVLLSVVALDVRLDIALSGSSAAVAALVTALLASVRTTTVVVIAVITQSLLSGLWNDNFGSVEWSVRLGFAIVLCAGALAVATSRARARERLGHMRVIAEAAQRAVLRAMPTNLGNVGFAARYVSATRDALIGGDLYEARISPYGVRVVVGDVRGKGIAAVQMAATVLTAFRQAAPHEASLHAVAAALDRAVTEVATDEDFVTVILAEFHDDHTVALVNCGHHGPLLIYPDGHAQIIEPGQRNPPLGLAPDPPIDHHDWPQGARMLLYTDGLVESRNPDGDFFLLVEHSASLQDRPLEEAIDHLLEQVITHTGSDITDDMALVMAEHH